MLSCCPFAKTVTELTEITNINNINNIIKKKTLIIIKSELFTNFYLNKYKYKIKKKKKKKNVNVILYGVCKREHNKRTYIRDNLPSQLNYRLIKTVFRLCNVRHI